MGRNYPEPRLDLCAGLAGVAFAIASNEHNPVGRFEFRRLARPGAASTRREYFRRLRFSPDGKYALAQSETGIAVLSVEPFRVAFRVPAENASDTEFTSDGHFVFLTGASHASSRELTYVNSPARRVRADAEAAEADRSTATSAFPCRFARSCCRPNPKVAISITTSGTASPIPRSIMQR